MVALERGVIFCSHSKDVEDKLIEVSGVRDVDRENIYLTKHGQIWTDKL